MTNPYTSPTIVNYNLNPPPDDGTEVASNIIKYSGIKTKLTDPVRDYVVAIDGAITTAFGKVVGGAGVVSLTGTYQISAADLSTTVAYTGAGGHTLTTPNASSVGAPWLCLIAHAGAGVLTIEGYDAQTVNGETNIALYPNSGGILFTDGSNWFFGGTFALDGGQIVSGTVDSDYLPVVAEDQAGILPLFTSAQGTARARYIASVGWLQVYGESSDLALNTLTEVEWTSVPAGATKLTLTLDAASLDGSDEPLLQLGTSLAYATSGYVGTAYRDGTDKTNHSTGFVLVGAGSNSHAYYGTLFLTKGAGHSWHIEGNVGAVDVNPSKVVGSVTLAAELTRVKLTRNGTDTYDGGTAHFRAAVET